MEHGRKAKLVISLNTLKGLFWGNTNNRISKTISLHIQSSIVCTQLMSTGLLIMCQGLYLI